MIAFHTRIFAIWHNGPAVKSISGFIRYAIEGDVQSSTAQIHVIDKGGIAYDLTSRTDRDPKLKGDKHLVASKQEVTITRGRHDQRIIILVPEIKGQGDCGTHTFACRTRRIFNRTSMQACSGGVTKIGLQQSPTIYRD